MKMEPVISTDPKVLDGIDQLDFLNHLKEWSVQYRGEKLTNVELAELALTTRKVVETWRCDPQSSTYRTMRPQDKALIALRLMESARSHRNNSRMSKWEKSCLSYYASEGVTKLTHIIGRHSLTIMSYLERNGIETPSLRTDWTSEEDDFLKENHKTMSAKDMAEKLNRTSTMVVCRKRALKLRRYKD